MPHSREYLEALVEELEGFLPEHRVTAARQRAVPRAGGRSYPRKPPDSSHLSEERLGKLGRSELMALRDTIEALLAGMDSDDEEEESMEKQSPTRDDVHVPGAMNQDEDDLGPEPSPPFTEEWIAWKTRWLILHEGMEPDQAAAVAHDMARRQEKSFPLEKYYGVPILKADEEHRVVTAPVLVPDKVDLQGDRVAEMEITKAAYRWMLRSRVVGVNHQGTLREGGVVESYIAPIDLEFEYKDQHFRAPRGTWVMSVKLGDDEWAAARAGQFNGFSIAGVGKRKPATGG